jgi:hypothetical protein
VIATGSPARGGSGYVDWAMLEVESNKSAIAISLYLSLEPGKLEA